jgi:hypothetical protein
MYLNITPVFMQSTAWHIIYRQMSAETEAKEWCCDAGTEWLSFYVSSS